MGGREGERAGTVEHKKRPQLFTIPAHRAFADTLVAGLMKRTGGDAMALARGLILLPNNRAARAVSAAFVRASGSGLLLPRLVTLGSPDLGEAVGAALDPVDDADPPPPAIAPMQRRMILARLVFEERAAAGAPSMPRRRCGWRANSATRSISCWSRRSRPKPCAISISRPS